MTQPAKGHEPSMEEILASIRRIIADEPGNSLRNEAARNEAARSEASRERMWRHDNLRDDSPRIDAPRREATGENPSRADLPPASPIGSIALSKEAQPPRADVLAQPIARNAAPALSAVPEATSESHPGPFARAGLSSVPQPATAQEEIEQIIAQLHTGPRPASPLAEEAADDSLELTEQTAAAEPLPAAEFASPDDLAQVVYEEEQEDGDEEEVQERHEEEAQERHEEEAQERHEEEHERAQEQEEAAAEAAEVEPTDEPQPIPFAQAAAREPYRPTHEQARDPVRDQVRGPDRDRSRRVAEQGLISAATGAAVDSAFNTLAQTVLVQNGRTLEDLVREMLRPMLKTWLDDNLPSLVERLVRAEIERVSRGRR